jgi:hypothetical protein
MLNIFGNAVRGIHERCLNGKNKLTELCPDIGKLTKFVV